MRPLALVLAAALVGSSAAAGSAPPTPDSLFCHGLKRVLDVAREDGDFTYLERSRAAPPRLGFRDGCRATGDASKRYWACTQSFAPETMSRDALAARVAACLPEAVRSAPTLARDALFTLPFARIHIVEYGGPGAHVGRIVQLVVEAVEATPAR